jgi:hypothetical protein
VTNPSYRMHRLVRFLALALVPFISSVDLTMAATAIVGEFTETHDRLPPHEWRGLKFVHHFTFTLAGKNDVSEQWSGEMISGGRDPEAVTAAPPVNPDLSPFYRRDSTLGATSGVATWHVLSERQLQRIYQGEHMLFLMSFNISERAGCRVDVKFLKQVGFTSVSMTRGDNGQPGNFSLPRVSRALCTIR